MRRCPPAAAGRCCHVATAIPFHASARACRALYTTRIEPDDNQCMAWGANQLRLTAFPAPTPVIQTPDWWAQATGGPPDQTAHNVKQAIFEASGTFGEGILTLRIQPLRIDWLYTPPMPDGLPAFRETIGPFQTAIDYFGPIVERWFGQEDLPEIVRLAFGSVLLDPVESRQAGYQQLARFIPDVKLDVENSSDFSYQINRPRRSAVVRDLMLNRLTKWSVGAFQAFVAHGGGVAFADKSFACRLETDINSNPDYGQPLPRAALTELFHEYVGLAFEILEKGDVS